MDQRLDGRKTETHTHAVITGWYPLCSAFWLYLADSPLSFCSPPSCCPVLSRPVSVMLSGVVAISSLFPCLSVRVSTASSVPSRHAILCWMSRNWKDSDETSYLLLMCHGLSVCVYACVPVCKFVSVLVYLCVCVCVWACTCVCKKCVLDRGSGVFIYI